MKKFLILSLIFLITINCVKTQTVDKYKLTATVSPLLFYKFNKSSSSEHFNNYNYSLGLLGSYYFGRKSKKIRFSINSGLIFKTKKYNSYYISFDNSIWAVNIQDYKYIGVPVLFGLDYKAFNNSSIDLLIGITLNRIVSTSYQRISVNGITEEMDPGLSYTGLNEFYSQLSFSKINKNRKFAISLGPFVS
ncbi:MAG: hypothetical protein B7C24_04060 [Bacteroidetes bacterium 4572_77]|nr:MAG: hypothetical protein B7C24_04060 [Bacteroidetes bacterium 4572_77]